MLMAWTEINEFDDDGGDDDDDDDDDDGCGVDEFILTKLHMMQYAIEQRMHSHLPGC